MNKKTAIAAVAALLVSVCEAVCPAYDTLIAHRGESVDAPENTLPAYRTAVECGFGGYRVRHDCHSKLPQ